MHSTGFHGTLDTRTAIPHPFLAYYPALITQCSLQETITILNTDGTATVLETGHPPRYAALENRESYDASPFQVQAQQPEKTQSFRLGDITLARSGDKGGNLNVGFFIPDIDLVYHLKDKDAAYAWLREYLSISRMKALLDEDWKEDEYFIERVEFPHIRAVHFVVYGILGRGVSSSSRLDGFGKGVADWLRDRVVHVPVGLLEKS
jgi:hypothetical protein